MNTYIIYWKDGKKETIRGETIALAFTSAGYGHGAIRAVDFYSSKPEEIYTYNQRTKQWEREWSKKK